MLLNNPWLLQLGRFFLVSDVLYNSSAKAMNASNFRSGFQGRMLEIAKHMHQVYDATESRLKAEAFRQRVMQCFRAWEDWNVYPQEFLIHLQNVFLGLVSVSSLILSSLRNSKLFHVSGGENKGRGR